MFYRRLFLSSLVAIFFGLIGIQADAQDLQMGDEQAEISGEVLDANSDEAVSNIEVKLEKEGEDDPQARTERDPSQADDQGVRSDQQEHTAFTDENGEFNLENVEPGEYTVRIDAEGYEQAEEKVNISEGDSEDLSIELQSDDDSRDDGSNDTPSF